MEFLPIGKTSVGISSAHHQDDQDDLDDQDEHTIPQHARMTLALWFILLLHNLHEFVFVA